MKNRLLLQIIIDAHKVSVPGDVSTALRSAQHDMLEAAENDIKLAGNILYKANLLQRIMQF